MKKKLTFEVVPAEKNELSYYWRNREKILAQKKEYENRPEVIQRRKNKSYKLFSKQR